MLILVGCNHRSAPVAFREQVAFRPDEVEPALARLLERDGIEEAFLLSTCNRVEILARGDRLPRSGVGVIQRFLCEERNVAPDLLRRYVYHVTGRGAVRHLLAVASGLDSMILGEPQILGQVKQAYLEARRANAVGTQLDRLLQHCLVGAKRIRGETGISRNPISVAYTAVRLARRVFGEIRGRRALLVGAGKMMHLVARHLVSEGVTDLVVTSRTREHADELARACAGRAETWQDGLSRVADVDIVVSGTASAGTVLDRERIAAAQRSRGNAPLFLVDIAVPRDVAPEAGALAGVHLYDIDGLQGVVDANLKERQRAAGRAGRAIEREVEEFERWRRSLRLAPTIAALHGKLLDQAQREVERFRKRLGPLSPEQERAVRELSRSLVQKILHRPVIHLRRSVDRGDIEASAALYREIFDLELPRSRPSGRSGARRRERRVVSDGRNGSREDG
jgi:glutamyl-tRNA reductase